MTQIINILDKDTQKRLIRLCEICEDLHKLDFATKIVIEDGRPPLLQIRRLTSKAKMK